MSNTVQNQYQRQDEGAQRKLRAETAMTSASASLLPEEKVIGAVPLPLRRFGGATLLRLCPAKKVCTNTRCWVQPFCKCARADWAAAKKSELRIWVGLAVCGGAVLAVALIRAMAFN